MEQQEEKKINSWADVQLNDSMPLNVLINFLNVLNQRLFSVENSVVVKGPNGEKMTLTELYAIQAEEALRQQEEEAKKQQEEKQGE